MCIIIMTMTMQMYTFLLQIYIPQYGLIIIILNVKTYAILRVVYFMLVILI